MTLSVILGQTNMAILKNWSGQGHIDLEGATNLRFTKCLLAAGKR